MLKFIFFIIVSTIALLANNDTMVKIAPNIPYVETVDHGIKVTIKRVEDTGHILTDDFAKTSRPCPPFCVQPIKPVDGIHNIEELELIDFINKKVATKKGLLIDARLKKWYELETIPGSINIPFVITDTKNPKIKDEILRIFGAIKKDNGEYDYTNAKDLALFCNGVWCGQSPRFIRNIVSWGYPKDKIYYYRSGFQGWKLLGLTTVIHKPEEQK